MFFKINKILINLYTFTDRQIYKFPKMKNILKFVLPLLLFFMTACSSSEVEQKPVYREIKDFYGKKVAATTGSSQESVLASEHPQIEILRFDTDADLLNALLTGKCEAIAFDYHIYTYFKQVMDNVAAMEEKLFSVGVGACFGKGYNEELREQFNVFLRQIKEDGTYDQIVDRWIHNAHTAVMPDIPVPSDGKPLRIATNTGAPPLVFVKDGELVGFDVEILKRFAASIGRSIVWSDMNFSALIPSLVSRTQDIAMCGINITDERKKSVDYSDPYFDCYSILVIREENSEGYVAGSGSAKGETFIQSVVSGFKRNILEENRYLLIWDGLKITVIISLLACLFGTLLGALVCWMRMNRNKYLRMFSNVYIALMRGMPVLVLLMIMFYVVFAGTSLSPITVAVITFGMNFAAYVSEMFRSAIESVDKGQTEAGVALGFTPLKTFIYIILPQAFKQVLPVFKGETISLVKTTSIVGFIAVQDLTKVGDIIRSRTFDAFFPLIMVAVLYFLISWLFAAVLDYIGKKAS